jgi:broad specificity phosphatase PhoE
MRLKKFWASAAVSAVMCLLALFIGAATAHADRTITLTFVRSAQSDTNAARLIDTSVPGPNLTPLGYQQAADAAKDLSANGYDGVYASPIVRSQETATPLSDAVGKPLVVLPGLREIEAGDFEGQPEPDTDTLDVTTAWVHGDRSARIPGSISGDEFDARFDEAVQKIYDSGDRNAVAFSHLAAMSEWVLMNVKNPNYSLYDTPLPNMGRIVIVGSPRGGWTLTNWDGTPVAP